MLIGMLISLENFHTVNLVSYLEYQTRKSHFPGVTAIEKHNELLSSFAKKYWIDFPKKFLWKIYSFLFIFLFGCSFIIHCHIPGEDRFYYYQKLYTYITIKIILLPVLLARVFVPLRLTKNEPLWTADTTPFLSQI